MPLLDVSELLSDPDFADDITVIRSGRTMGTDGRVVDTPGTYYTYGNVQPTSGASLQQLPEAERVGSFITVVTPFRLLVLTDSTAPDQVIWQDRNYRVKHVNDWSVYGNGFTEAICELTGMTQNGP